MQESWSVCSEYAVRSFFYAYGLIYEALSILYRVMSNGRMIDE
jgi:hypothetical protein